MKSVPRQDLIPPLDCGLLAPAAAAANGALFPQPRVKADGKSMLLDDVAGQGADVGAPVAANLCLVVHAAQ